MSRMLKALSVVGLILFAVATAACQTSQPQSNPVGEAEQVGGEAVRDAELDSQPFKGEALRAASDSAAPQGQVDQLPPIPQAPSKVIKNASIEVRIADGSFQSKFSRANLLAEQLGGFVTNSTVTETEDEISSGTVTIRVPADKFQTAIDRLRALGDVTSEQTSGRDVTKEFVDLEARLRHAKAQEAFFLRLMNESKTISDLIQVQQQLSNVQLQIEQIQGELQFLNDQSSFSTITAQIFEPGAEASQPKGLSKAFSEAWDGFQSVVGGLVVSIGWLAPIALLGFVGWLIFRLARKRGRAESGQEA